MKKTVIGIVLATFAGVFGALQLDHMLERRQSQELFASSGDSSKLYNAEYDVKDVAPAPFDFMRNHFRASTIDNHRWEAEVASNAVDEMVSKF